MLPLIVPPQQDCRLSTGMRYSIEYAILSEEHSDADYYRFDSGLASVVFGDTLEHRNPFLFNDNTV